MKPETRQRLILLVGPTLFVLGIVAVLAAIEPDPNCTSNDPADCMVEMPCQDGIMCCLCCGDPRSIKYADDQAERMRLHLATHTPDECGWCVGDTAILCKHGNVIATREIE